MAERDGQLRRGADAGTDLEVEPAVDRDERTDPAGAAAGDRVRARLRRGAGRVVSARALALSLVLVTAGVLVAGRTLPLGPVGGLVGTLAGGFLYGVATDARRYFEVALAGAVVAGASALLGNPVLSLVGLGLPLVAIGAVTGGLAALLGHYFGRDLRDGLTREI